MGVSRSDAHDAASMPIDGLGLDTRCYMVHGTKFEVSQRYTVLEPVGQGAYGIVCAARDEVTGERIAIKKIENAFEHITFTKRTLRELRILRHLRHENLIDVRSIFLPGQRGDFEDIYVFSELMETDLASILKSSQPMTDEHCQFFLYQILRGMKYVHSALVIHRDLKPRNLLVNANCDLKICDFGLARMSYRDSEFQTCPMTEYVCTRWYRAPEVLCSWADYTAAIDVWSVGCIFAEMLSRQPLFPGHNTQHQLQLIIGLVGTPGKEELRKIPNEKCRRFIDSLPTSAGRPFESISKASPEAVGLLKGVLQFDPEKRISAADGLANPYLAQLACPEDEPVRTPLDTSDFEFERRKINIKALREELFLEAMQYYPEIWQKHCEGQQQGAAADSIINCRLLAPGEAQYSSEDEDGAN